MGRYGRFEPQRTAKYTPPSQSLTRRSRGTIDYSSDTEATLGSRSNLYYYNRPPMGPAVQPPRGTPSGLIGGPDFARFNSLPRDRPGARLNLRTRLGDRLSDDSDGNLSAPEYSLPLRGRERGNKQQLTGLAKLLNDPNLADLRSRLTASPSIFTSDEYKAWLRRAPSSSAIVEQMRASRDLLNQQRAHRFSCSAENIHDALKNVRKSLAKSNLYLPFPLFAKLLPDRTHLQSKSSSSWHTRPTPDGSTCFIGTSSKVFVLATYWWSTIYSVT